MVSSRGQSLVAHHLPPPATRIALGWAELVETRPPPLVFQDVSYSPMDTTRLPYANLGYICWYLMLRRRGELGCPAGRRTLRRPPRRGDPPGQPPRSSARGSAHLRRSPKTRGPYP